MIIISHKTDNAIHIYDAILLSWCLNFDIMLLDEQKIAICADQQA